MLLCLCSYNYFKRLWIYEDSVTYSWILMPLIWQYLVFLIMKELTNFRLLDMDFYSVDLRGNIFLALYIMVIYSRIIHIALLSSPCSLVHLLVHTHINVHFKTSKWLFLLLLADCHSLATKCHALYSFVMHHSHAKGQCYCEFYITFGSK